MAHLVLGRVGRVTMVRSINTRSMRRISSSTRSSRTSLVPVSQKQADQNQSRTLQRLVKLTRGIAPERKFHDVSSAFSGVTDTAGSVAPIANMAQGDTQLTRTGNKIRVKEIQIQCRVATGTGSIGATPSNEEFIRFFLVQDKQQVGDTDLVPSDVFVAVGSPQTPWMNISTQGRFSILWRSKLLSFAMMAQSSLQAALTTPVTPTQVPVVMYRKFCDIPLTFNGAAGTDIQKNGLYLVALTSSGSDTVDAGFYTRVTFIDD